MRSLCRLALALFAMLQLASCGAELVGSDVDEDIQVPPPSELITSLPDDPGEVMASGVDPSASSPPPPPFDR